MDERFERDLRVGLAALLDPVVERHPAWETSPAAAQVVGVPARRRLPGRLTLLWAAVLAALLLAAALAAAAFVGSQRNQAVVIAPSPLATMTVTTEAADILATTKAHPLPAQATCPPGSNPNAPGSAGQDRPTGGTWHGDVAMAFDRHAGRVVLLAPDERDPYGRAWQTWTYDVCANTWQRMSPAMEPPAADRLVYDADSDRILAFTNVGNLAGGEIWSYDLAADRWTQVGSVPWAGDNDLFGTIFYHDPSGLVVAYDGVTMWAFDVDSTTLAKVRQRPDPAQPVGAGLPQGNVALGYDPGHDQVVAVAGWYSDHGVRLQPRNGEGPADTWTFDPGTGSWRKETAPAFGQLIVCGGMGDVSVRDRCYPTNGRAVYDEAAGLTVFMNGVAFGISRIDAWDAGQRAWLTLFPGISADQPSDNWCTSLPPVYDPLNRRIVCLPDGDAVSAFSTATGQWRWLLEPSTTPPPTPTLAPGATPIDWGTPAPGGRPTSAPASTPPTPAPTQAAP